MDPSPEIKKPDVPPQPAKQRSQKETDAYAQSLIKMVNMDYAERQANMPKQKRYFSKKRLIYLAVSTIVGIILTVAYTRLTKNETGSGTQGDQSQQILNSVRTFNDSNSY